MGSVAALVALAPASADAAFTLNACAGSAITGRGASFQNAAQSGFNQAFRGPDACDAAAPGVTYDPAGSGAGRRALGERSAPNTTGARDAAIRFGATDDPPTPTQQGQINNGLDAAGDEGTVHVIPVAVGPVVPTVNFPAGCLPAGTAKYSADAGDDNAANTQFRFKVSNAQWELAWAGDANADTWGEFLGGAANITANPPDGGANDAACAVHDPYAYCTTFYLCARMCPFAE